MVIHAYKVTKEIGDIIHAYKCSYYQITTKKIACAIQIILFKISLLMCFHVLSDPRFSFF